MRKITQEAINAFINWEDYSKDNTRVKKYPHCTTMYLHWNEIAIKSKDTWLIEISNAGWFSTTKERLNGIPWVSIVQKKGKWYLNGNEWNGNWITIS